MPLLNHLACIMDGNRRWATSRGMMPWAGHQEGVIAVRRTIAWCLSKQIRFLSLYAFSLENLARPEHEKRVIFDLLVTKTEEELPQLLEHGVRVNFVGDRALFGADILRRCEQIEQETSSCNKLMLYVLFCYGSRQEIVAAAQKLAEKTARGELDPVTITVDMFKRTLWTGDVPDPELIIRTGGYSRLSNFMLFQAAYAELYVTQTLWPDMNDNQLNEAYRFFEESKRNFGR